MNNWPFRRNTQAPWWFPVLGVYSIIALVVLLPILVGVLCVFGFFLYTLAQTGAVGVLLSGFLLLALAMIVWGILKVGA